MADAETPNNDRLNSLLAVTIAVVATFLGICNVKDGNVVQAMQVAQLELSQSPNAAELATKWKERVARYEKEKQELKEKAETLEGKHEALGITDDQFDFAEAFLSISIALLGIAALIKRMLLVYTGAVFALTGAFFGICGFTHLSVHPSWLAALLG